MNHTVTSSIGNKIFCIWPTLWRH